MALTLAELARRTGKRPALLAIVLAEAERQGIVERVGDGYRLTAEGERLHGRHLRNIMELS